MSPINNFDNDLFFRWQIHLTHDDFVSVFKMEYQEFESLPKWRQTQLKKEYRLF